MEDIRKWRIGNGKCDCKISKFCLDLLHCLKNLYSFGLFLTISVSFIPKTQNIIFVNFRNGKILPSESIFGSR